MKKSILRKIGVGLAVGALLLSTTGCGGATKKDAKTSSDELTIYTEAATYEGKLDGYVGKMFKEKVGVDINVVPNSVGGTSRFETRLTTGNLGDLIVFTSQDDFDKAIKSGAVEDISSKLKDLPNVNRFADAVERMKNNYDGKVYGIPTGVSLESEVTKGDPAQVPSLRYDYYKELGSPEIPDYWGYADVIEQMVAKHPTTENGDKFYGLSMFSEWDGKSVNQIRSIAKAQGWINLTDFLNVRADSTDTEDLLAENGSYLQGLKWANNFYQKGLLDPDSASQTWEDFLKKAEKGQSAMWIFGYMGDLNFNPVNKDLTAEGKGYKRVVNQALKATDQKTNTFGDNWFWAVSANSENKEKAYKFLDYLYSDEGSFTYENGPKGVIWDLNEEDEPYLTEIAQGSWEAKVPEEDGGGVVSDTFKKRVNAAAMSPNATNPLYNSPSTYNTWKSYLLTSASELDKEWMADHGDVLNVKEYMMENDMVVPYSGVTIPPMKYSDEQQVVANQVGDVIKEMSWQMIYAKDDATFEQIETEMIKKAKNLGYDDCLKAEKDYAKEYFEARDAVE
ncbi:TPA: extracellular solute-binding protein [Enterococcus faecium]|uniref:extracellular solute-binding protein n=1 Tax=Enterococcus lactis TaxID=357441 RepID=UPI0036392898